MKNPILTKAYATATLVISAFASLLLTTPSYASMKCEEQVSRRFCSDGAPKLYSPAPGVSASVPAPILQGYDTACWSWSRQFQCIETDPKYSCASGTPYQTVKNECSLVKAVTNATMTINGVSYITSATYDYRCAFGEWSTNDALKPNRECIQLDSHTSDTKTEINVATGRPEVVEQVRDDNYVCYLPPVKECSDKCYKHETDPVTGKIVDVETPCAAAVSQCAVSSSQCEGTQVFNKATGKFEITQQLGPDGRCVQSTDMFTCVGGEIPRCLTKENCSITATAPSNIQDNGVAASQEQTYVCSNTTKSCAQTSTVSNCVHVSAWGWDNMGLKDQIGQGLDQANEALAKIEGIEKGQKTDDPYIFSGMDLRCHFAVGNFLNTFLTIAAIAITAAMTGGASIGIMGNALVSAGLSTTQAVAVQVGMSFVSEVSDSKAFGADCCKDYIIEGSDAWYKLGSCTADEVKLAVARQKDLDVYLGEYCSKKGGFPIRQCVERTRTFCVFDDMLALTVNQQGRKQLDELAVADPIHTTVTAEKPFQLFNTDIAGATKYSNTLNNGKWVKQGVEAGSQMWTWLYPGYCRSSARQAEAYTTFTAELNALADTKGKPVDQMSPEEKKAYLLKMMDMPSFQECASTPGTLYLLSCGKLDDSCNESKLPESPNMVGSTLDASPSDADVNWRVGQVRTFYKPGDYGVMATMPSNPSFAAMTASMSEFITGTGSCHVDGNCLYKFAVTDKRGVGSLGARKRTVDKGRFTLYSVIRTGTQPAISYVSKDGVLDMAAYKADPTRGSADPLYVSSQRFIFHPHFITKQVTGNIHSHVLLEYANRKVDDGLPANDYTPLLLPTSLPPGTPGWYPYGDPSTPGRYFYISGGCDINSRWCEYTIEVDLNVPRHPWGTAQEPRCWGFTLDQMAALDFNKMDLSQWINSLDFGSGVDGMGEKANAAMTQQVTDSAQAFYNATATGTNTSKPGAGQVALVTSSDVLPNLSGDNFATYTLQAAVPSNWPAYVQSGPNNNPVSDVTVDWGDGSPVESMPLHSEGKAFLGKHDFGDKKIGQYTITVKLNTKANGKQTLTRAVTITPNKGETPAKPELQFNNPGSAGKPQADYNPSETVNGTSQSKDNLTTQSPGMVDNFDRQGNTVTAPPPKTGGTTK